jgi:ParB family chromosome partitioning protein
VTAIDPAVDIPTDHTTAAEQSSSDGSGVEPGGEAPAASSITLEDGSEYLLVNPRDLIIGPNVRTEADLDKDFKGFAKDIGNRGVRAPIIVQRNADGELVVVEGQMRTLAAVDAGKPLVRVLVEPDLAADEKAREITRIVNQLGDNFHRTANTEADEIRATQQLVLNYGVSARALEQLRSIPRKRAQALVSVARSAAASRSVTDGIADLTQAAVFVEFDGDDDAIAVLTECMRKDPARFDHVAQALRDDREETRLRAEVTAQLVEQGLAVIDEPDTYGGPVRPLRELRATEKTQAGTRVSVKRHAKCPGHAAYLEYADKRIEVVYVCTDFREHKHPLLWASTVSTAVEATARGGSWTEEQKAERRTVIRNGKAWDSATTVRRSWLSDFAARKTPPKDAAAWMARMQAEGSPALRAAMEQDHPLAVDLLGLTPKEGRSRYRRAESHPIADAAETATPGRAAMLSLVMLLAAIEESTDRRRTWDTPSREQIAYFTRLAAWGYPPEDVEKLVIAHGHPAETAPVADNPAETDSTVSLAATDSGGTPGDSLDQDPTGDPAHLLSGAQASTPVIDAVTPDDLAGEDDPVALAA